MNTIDLDNPPPNQKVTVSVEPAESTADSAVRLVKECTLFGAAIIGVVIIGWICVHTTLSSSASQEDKKWAMSILTAIVGALIGYLIRGQNK